MISLNAIGKDTRHTGDFCIWRPDGSGDNLLVIFKTSALLIIDGNEIIVPPDSLIIYKKDTPQYYKTICGNYANHFIHFNVTDDDNILDTVETDRLITSVNISAVEELLTILCRENMSPSEHRRQYADMLIRMILMKISEGGGESSDGEHTYSEQLRQLRADIYSNAGGIWLRQAAGGQDKSQPVLFSDGVQKAVRGQLLRGYHFCKGTVGAVLPCHHWPARERDIPDMRL